MEAVRLSTTRFTERVCDLEMNWENAAGVECGQKKYGSPAIYLATPVVFGVNRMGFLPLDFRYW